MSSRQDLQREVEITRRQLSETVDELVHKVDLKGRARPVIRTLRDYQVPIALVALSLLITLWPKKK